MAKIRKNGVNPVNARINIKYRDRDKPKISFSYPDKRTQFRGSMFGWVRTFSLLLFVLLWLGFLYGEEGFLYGEDYRHNYIYEKSSLQKYAECAALNFRETLTNYTNIQKNLCKEVFGSASRRALIRVKGAMFFAFFLWWGLPALIYFPFKKNWDKLYPKWQGFIARKKLRIFYPKDVQEKDGFYFVELPVFSNVVCDFNAQKDFSKYLKEIDIREYKFHHFKKRRIKIGKKRVKHRKVNEWIWYARWYFDKKPINGKLGVIYK